MRAPLVLVLATPSLAAVTFQWTFTTAGTPLSQCGTAGFAVLNNTVNGTITPPLFLYSVPTGGIPTVTKLSNGYSGEWIVPYRQTTQLQLEIVDSAGNEGGWVSESVAAGTSDTCIKPTTSTVQLGLNTTSVAPCGTVGVQMGGTGQAPFQLLVLPAAGSYTKTQNFSLGPTDSYLNFVANISGGSAVLIAGRDSQGNWAPTSPVVSISGPSSNVVDCRSLVSFSGSGPPAGVSNPVTSSPAPTGGASPSGSSSNAGAIAGGVVGGVVGALAILAVVFFLLKRRRRDARHKYMSGTRPTMDDDGDVPMSQNANVTPFSLSSHSAALAPSSELLRLSSSGGPSSESSLSPGPAGQPLPSSIDATSQVGVDGHPVVLPAGAFSVSNPDDSIAAMTTKAGQAGPSTPTEFVQHTDGGRVRQDVPPAYGSFIDRQRSLREART